MAWTYCTAWSNLVIWAFHLEKVLAINFSVSFLAFDQKIGDAEYSVNEIVSFKAKVLFYLGQGNLTLTKGHFSKTNFRMSVLRTVSRSSGCFSSVIIAPL